MSSTSRTTITDSASIASHNQGPIPTTFSEPKTCFGTPTSVNAYTDNGQQYGGGPMYNGHFASTNYYDPACYPSSTTTSTSLAWELYYYSPAISCPTGWQSFDTTISGIFSGADSTDISLGPETTAAVCCPTGYVPNAWGVQNLCSTSLRPLSTVISYFAPTLVNPGSYYVPDTLATETYNLNNGGFFMMADGIPIWYQFSDLPTTTTNSQTSSPTTSSSSPTSSTSSSSSSGLSSGAKAGIGIAVAVAVIAVAALAWFLIRRRRNDYRMSPNETPSPQELHGGGANKPELGSPTP